MWLRFKPYGYKHYAATPGGEYAFGSSQGLYEWRNGSRIDYLGGDRQISSQGGLHSVGRPYCEDHPLQRGFAHALVPYRRATN